MTDHEKSDLQWKVRWYLGNGTKDADIVKKLTAKGFEKATIKKYIKAFKNT